MILGREGWLFYADDSALEDYQSAELLTPEELEAWRQELVGTRDWLRAQGTAFVFMVVPDKHVIYPEFLPESIHRLHSTYRGEQLVRYLRERTDLSVVDGQAILMARKPIERVYSTTDTHWNDRGVYVGYEALVREAGREIAGLAPLPRTRFLGSGTGRARGGSGCDARPGRHPPRACPRSRTADLPRRATLMEPADLHEGYEVARVVTEISDARLPRAVIFRDSFMSAMVPFLSEHFSRAVYMWQNDVDRDLVLRERPNLVILEIVGRRLQTYVP